MIQISSVINYNVFIPVEWIFPKEIMSFVFDLGVSILLPVFVSEFLDTM